ncbi:MAG TPA: hypothetical protein PLA88_09585, partial [Bacteroidales bacterium]|nr:hypothetical protein [Bacteroidales bacterium]
MILKKLRQLSPVFFICLSAVLLVLIYFIPAGNQRNSDRQLGIFKSSVEDVITEADSLLKWASNPMYLKDPFSLLSVSSFREKTQSLHTTIFISRNDSLVFWSDNHTPFPSESDSIQSGKIVFDGNGFYLVRAEQSGSYRLTALVQLQSSYFYHNSYLISRISPNLCSDCCFGIASDPAAADTLLTVQGVSQPVPITFTKEEMPLSPAQDITIVLLLFVSLVLLAMAFYGIAERISPLKKQLWLRLIYLAVVPVILYLLGKEFLSLPVFIHLSVNNPAFFAYSSRFPQLAPLLLAAFLFITWISYFSRELLLLAGRKRKNVFSRVAFLFVTFVCTALLGYYEISGINSFLFNTS